MSSNRSFRGQLRGSLDARRIDEADIKHTAYQRPYGTGGIAAVRPVGRDRSYLVTGPADVTWRPGTVVPTGSHTGYQREVIVGPPPPGKRGAGNQPPKRVERRSSGTLTFLQISSAEEVQYGGDPYEQESLTGPPGENEFDWTDPVLAASFDPSASFVPIIHHMIPQGGSTDVEIPLTSAGIICVGADAVPTTVAGIRIPVLLARFRMRVTAGPIGHFFAQDPNHEHPNTMYSFTLMQSVGGSLTPPRGARFDENRGQIVEIPAVGILGGGS